jgi:hypothetical protein
VHVHVRLHVYKCQNAGLSGIRSVQVQECKKLTMPGSIRYRIKPTKSGFFLVWYRHEIMDAGMPMPELVSSVPMPSFAYIIFTCNLDIQTGNLKKVTGCAE